MKRMLAALMAALMLVTILPLASPPARAAGVTFGIGCSVNPAEQAYVGEKIQWRIENVSGGSGNYLCSLDVWKDGQHFSEGDWNLYSHRYYEFPSPGKYKVEGWVKDTGDGGKKYSQFSEEITVKASPLKITRVEPVSATSLRITWSTVPGALEYGLYRSTDMRNWEWIKTTTGTSFTDTSLKPGTSYFYSVGYLRLGIFNAVYSPVAAGVPMGKTRITGITSPARRQVKLTWSRASEASGYQVALSTSPNGAYKTVRILSGTTVTFYGINSGTALFFKVRPYKRISKTAFWGQYSAYRSIRVK